MSRIWVKGGRRLQGEVTVQGSKNAVLPILSAAVLNPGITELEGVPDIADVRVGIEILRSLGAEIEWQGHRLSIDGRGIRPEPVPEELGERMRSSVLFLGPLLARFGEASVCRPGGCAIGKRPVDLHLEGLRQLGAKFDLSEERIHGRAAELKPVQIRLRLPSVGATQQLVMAACGVTGMVTLSGCAREPEVEALCCFLEAVGVAQIRGAGTSRIRILGGGCCRPTRFFVPGDRIAAGTYPGCSSRNRGNSHRAGNLPLAVEADAAAVSPDGMPDSDRGGFYSDIRTGAGSSSVSCDRSVSWLSHGYAVSISDARGSSGGKICTGGDDFRVEAFSGGGAEPDGSRNLCLRSEGGDPRGSASSRGVRTRERSAEHIRAGSGRSDGGGRELGGRLGACRTRL